MESALKNVKNSIAKVGSALGLGKPQPQKLMSPIPVTQQYTSGLAYKQQQEQALLKNAQQRNKGTGPTPTPIKIQYPQWIANAPKQPVAAPAKVAVQSRVTAPARVVAPARSGQVQSARTAVPAVETIKANLDKGFKKYGSPPIATMSAALAQVGHEVAQRGGNPYLPAALTLKETSGLKHGPAQKINNPVGIGPGISYPNLEVAILGGGPQNQQGLRGVLNNGYYDDYYKSGNLQDFFKRYTPQESHNNPTYKQQIALMNELLKLFEE